MTVAPRRSIPCERDSCELIQIVDDQSEQVIVEAPAGFVEEQATVKHLRKSLHVALLQVGVAVVPALLSRLVGDYPIGIGGPGDALHALKHVTLAKSEVRYVDRAVAGLR